MTRRRTRRLGLMAAGFLAVIGLWQVGEGGWIHAKAALARYLIAAAWAETLTTGGRVRPWPWADSWPVALLRFPNRNEDIIVLDGASGATLAFGPGYLDGTAPPGTPGSTIIAGHRDTSFTFLGDLREGEPVRLQRNDGRWIDYRITGSGIADARYPWIPPAPAKAGASTLTFVTCWPFDAIVPGGPLRYLVFAEEVPRGTPGGRRVQSAVLGYILEFPPDARPSRHDRQHLQPDAGPAPGAGQRGANL